MREALQLHGQSDHRPNGPDPVSAHYCIVLSGEEETPSTGDGLWTFPVEHDWAGTFLQRAEAYVSTAGSGVTRIQLHTNGADLLLSRIEIDAGQKLSWQSSPLTEIDGDADPFVLGEDVRIDLDNIGSGAMGLKLMLTMGPRIVRFS